MKTSLIQWLAYAMYCTDEFNTLARQQLYDLKEMVLCHGVHSVHLIIIKQFPKISEVFVRNKLCRVTSKKTK